MQMLQTVGMVHHSLKISKYLVVFMLAWGRFAFGAGDAWTLGYFDDANLYARD